MLRKCLRSKVQLNHLCKLSTNAEKESKVQGLAENTSVSYPQMLRKSLKSNVQLKHLCKLSTNAEKESKVKCSAETSL